MVPAEARIEVEAKDAKEALKAAMAAWQRNKSLLIVANSADEQSAVDWQPTAERIES